MKNAVLILFVVMFVAFLAFADTGWKINGTNAIGQADNVARIEAESGVELITDVDGEAKGLTVRASGDVAVPVTSMTPVANFTPVTGSYLKPGVNMVPTASPTLAVVFLEPHKMLGATKLQISDSANPTLIHPLPNAAGTPSSINAAAAGTPYSSAAGAVTECIGVTLANARCRAR